MDWKLLGSCVAALECAVVLACCVWVGARALRKLPATLLLALALFAADATLTAQKTNNVPPNMNSPLPQMQQEKRRRTRRRRRWSGSNWRLAMLRRRMPTSTDMSSGSWRFSLIDSILPTLQLHGTSMKARRRCIRPRQGT